ncbi:coiled-coil domain-containing protein 106b isoform X1 [Pangasianodon hypophthalmus]|uniref:coiled-coil domain-containing protein 106b isoform X1 n=1 Tax=Pangasianodon hypophthalmus TaxID=310915 RepID=UPI000EFF9093|nr:coiled-coil domain-containing protein 106b isoform X1 [Pangasianodon hypophthalmus]XP_053087574.1 coiled-coil domain-containing protein 106b isoform X1 [Pangasianodon hypophthalmus]
MTEPQRSTRNSTDLKNEDGYEISIPFEDSSADQSGFYNQNDHMFDAESASGQTPPCNPYLLISNLRAQLQISLEKNSWLQKRIEDLEEERDFLRCQLDRFIFTTKSQERNELQPEVPQQPTSQKTVLRRASTPSPLPMMTRSGQARSQTLKRKKKKNSVQDEEDEEVIEEEEFIEEDGYLEEEEIVSNDDDSDTKSCRRSRAKSRSNGGPTRVKRTRVFRIARGMERQRVKDPAGVLFRYKKILVTYQKLKSMSRAFQVHGVDRNTVASTTPIAELLLVAPEKVEEVGEFDSSKEKLLDYARRCYKALDETAHAKVQALKKNNLLLPISYRFRN